MAAILDEKFRHLLPRWRDFATTARIAELDNSLRDGASPTSGDRFFGEKVAAWTRERTVITATELVAAAFVNGRPEEARDPAQFLLESEKRVRPSVLRVAAKVLNNEQHSRIGVWPTSELGVTDFRNSNALVRRNKANLRNDPRNAVSWVDLARAYSLKGQIKQATQAMQTALVLAPTNRFVLRAATRFFVHSGEPDRAHDILRKNEIARVDPWIMAAELAVAMAADRSPAGVKHARRALASTRFYPLHLSELAGALATQEFVAGSGRKARKLFQQSLEDPTENSIAQARWVSRELSRLPIGQELLDRPGTYEARYFEAYYSAHDWKQAIEYCGEWLRDEPFSSRPALSGSFVAATALGDAKLSEQFCKYGLDANPNDSALINNYVVALACQGQVEKARQWFSKIKPSDINAEVRATRIATEGLLCFRERDSVRGQEYYFQAIGLAKENGDRHTQLLAELHLIREMLIANMPGSEGALHRAISEVKASGDPLVEAFFKQVVNLSSNKN